MNSKVKKYFDETSELCKAVDKRGMHRRVTELSNEANRIIKTSNIYEEERALLLEIIQELMAGLEKYKDKRTLVYITFEGKGWWSEEFFAAETLQSVKKKMESMK